MEIVSGIVKEIRDDGNAVIIAALPDISRALYREYDNGRVAVGFDDGRRITAEQRRKVYAILGDISIWQVGDRTEVETIKRHLKLDFVLHRLESLAYDMFSLSNCSITMAREFITFLLDFCLEWDIPLSRPAYELADDITKYVYSCLINKRCAVCGQKAELHHVDRVGMGRNRDRINHIGMMALPLCRRCHTVLHDTGDKDFITKYHLEPVAIDEQIAKVYRLRAVEE